MNWINAKDQLPDLGQEVLAYVKFGYYFDFKGRKDDRPKSFIIGYLWKSGKDVEFVANCQCSGCEHDRENLELIYWTPLPEAPE